MVDVAARSALMHSIAAAGRHEKFIPSKVPLRATKKKTEEQAGKSSSAQTPLLFTRPSARLAPLPALYSQPEPCLPGNAVTRRAWSPRGPGRTRSSMEVLEVLEGLGWERQGYFNYMSRGSGQGGRAGGKGEGVTRARVPVRLSLPPRASGGGGSG